MNFYHTKAHAGRRHCYLYHPFSRATCLWGFTVREQDLGTVPWPLRCVARRLSCRDDFMSHSPHLWLIVLRFDFKAETIDYWVWSSVSKRPGHFIPLLYWSIWRSHHWLNHTDPVLDQCSLVQQFNHIFLFWFVSTNDLNSLICGASHESIRLPRAPEPHQSLCMGRDVQSNGAPPSYTSKHSYT